MSVYRYLLNVAYMGKPFLGAQRQVKGTFPRAADISTIQGRLEMGLKLLNPSLDPIVVLSSRTDAGVHAISSMFHVDLQRSDNTVYEPKTLTICLNKYFKKADVPIRVLNTYLVPSEFHCRYNAISRSYLYKLCIINIASTNGGIYLKHIPIEELQRCFFFCSDTFNINNVREATSLFLGWHDFRTFMGKGSKDLEKMTRKCVERFDILEVQRATYSYPPFVQYNADDYRYFHIFIKAQGFLYRQIRMRFRLTVSCFLSILIVLIPK